MLYVITAVHNRYKITESFVIQLMKQTYTDFKLVVVDDGSTDGTADMIKSYLADSIILHGDGNLWWGGALHKAYKWIKANANPDGYVMIANDDTEFPDDYLERAVATISNNPEIILAGHGLSKQTGMTVDGAVTFDFLGGSANINKDGYTGNCASTRSTFLTVNNFVKSGGFHPILLPHYASDYEWAIRTCKKCNIKVLCEPTLQYKANEETTGDHSKSHRTLKQLMSKRSVSNPIYKTTFCLLSSPWGLKIKSALCMIKRFAHN